MLKRMIKLIFPRSIVWLVVNNLLFFLLINTLKKIEYWLLEHRYLNTKDIGFVGNEQATLFEYLTNVWHWDAAIGILFLSMVIYAFVSVFQAIDIFQSRKARNS